LFDKNKQIVFSSDRTPQQLELEERLSSRLLSGLPTEIKKTQILENPHRHPAPKTQFY